MASDFRPKGIRTLLDGEKNSLAGLRGLRAGEGLTYRLSRDGASQVADGIEDTFPHGLGETTSDDTVTVFVDDVEQTGGGVDYAIDGDNVVFEAGSIPSDEAVIACNATSVAADVVAGACVFFDTQKINYPIWDSIVPTGETVVEIM